MKFRRKPTTPGEILSEEFIKPLGITQKHLADHLKCDVKVINRIVNDRASLTAEMAIKLAAALKTTPEFWMNAQQAVDVYHANKALGKHLPKPLHKNEAA
jgi:addiction module HigA family antidote